MKWEIHPAAKLEHDDLITFFAGVDESLVRRFTFDSDIKSVRIPS